MNVFQQRAIKIVELQEELEEAKQIIKQFLYPSDMTKQEIHSFKLKASKIAGCSFPTYSTNTSEKSADDLFKNSYKDSLLDNDGYINY